jgi:hypothetical protein
MSLIVSLYMCPRIVVRSLVGTFVYMVVKSRNANFMFLSYGMALKSFISWTMFSALNA